jgi:ligand-binding SRPBCC domain-containing protein
MPTIVVETPIAASPLRCFDLARDIDLHCASTSRTQERAVAGVTTGLIGDGDAVTFEAVHFGVRQRLTARIVLFEPPHRFVDEMTQGAFQAMRHTHEFLPEAGGTRMRDTLTWTSPLGPLGVLADHLFLIRYMTRFVQERNAVLKAAAEKTENAE